MTKTAQEIREELVAKNSEARALRRALKEAEKAELVSAKKALGEAFAGAVFCGQDRRDFGSCSGREQA